MVNGHLNWIKAETCCKTNYNGTLLSIDSEEEQGFVSRVLSQEPFDIFINAQFVWTGLFQLNGQWRQPECKVSNVLKDTHLNSFKNLISKRYTRFATDCNGYLKFLGLKFHTFVQNMALGCRI